MKTTNIENNIIDHILIVGYHCLSLYRFNTEYFLPCTPIQDSLSFKQISNQIKTDKYDQTLFAKHYTETPNPDQITLPPLKKKILEAPEVSQGRRHYRRLCALEEDYIMPSHHESQCQHKFNLQVSVKKSGDY